MFESIPQQEAASNFDQQGANTAKVVDLFYSNIYLLNSEENKEFSKIALLILSFISLVSVKAN